MSAALQRPMSLEDFLGWEETQPIRWEFDGVAPVAMTGGTIEYAAIQANLYRALGNRLHGGPCRVLTSHLEIRAAGSIRYPDAFVVCTPQRRGATMIEDPVVVFEILSDSTAVVDRVVKNQEYRDTPSVRRYVMLEQDQMAATVFERAGDDWIGHPVSGDTILAMPEIGVEVPLAEPYDGVTFELESTER